MCPWSPHGNVKPTLQSMNAYTKGGMVKPEPKGKAPMKKKLVKGSPEAKAFMAKLRAMRK